MRTHKASPVRIVETWSFAYSSRLYRALPVASTPPHSVGIPAFRFLIPSVNIDSILFPCAQVSLCVLRITHIIHIHYVLNYQTAGIDIRLALVYREVLQHLQFWRQSYECGIITVCQLRLCHSLKEEEPAFRT